MSNQTKLKYLFAVLPCLLMGIAHAGNVVSEFEPNNPIASPQHLVAPADVAVPAFLGNAGTDDLDYYMFYANAGDVVTVDIDNGWGGGGSQNVDTMIAIFDNTSAHSILRFDDDASLDPGSTSTLDSRIDNFVVPASGFYIVGVTNYPRYFMSGGGVMSGVARQGDYTLTISGVTTSTKQIAILIKPGNNYTAPINPRSHGKIPVAILGGPDFDTSSIDTKTLTFGSNGDEASLSKCNSERVDLNNDGRLDLLCHFNNQDAHFKLTDAEGTLRGQTFNGTQFEGKGYLKVIPMKGGVH
jgi:hypothetical protein